MPIKNFFNRNNKSFDIDKAMQKAVASPDYNKNLYHVARETLNLNIQELQSFPCVIEQLENCKSNFLLATLMHNVVLLCRNKRHSLIPYLHELLHSIRFDINKSDSKELKEEYYYCLKKLSQVKKSDTHPHVMYYDLSNFLSSFFTFTFKLGKVLTEKQNATLEQLRVEMIAIMKQTKDEKEETVRKCRKAIGDTKSE